MRNYKILKDDRAVKTGKVGYDIDASTLFHTEFPDWFINSTQGKTIQALNPFSDQESTFRIEFSDEIKKNATSQKKIAIDRKSGTVLLNVSQSKRFKTYQAMTDAEFLSYTLSKVGIASRLGMTKLREDSFRKRNKAEVSKKARYLRENDDSFRTVHEKITHRESNYYLNLFKESLRNTLAPKKNLSYYGIEIECLIPLESLDLCESDYESSGMRECPDCEGSGEVTYEHRDSGNTLEATCPCCGGDGEIEDEDNDKSDNLYHDAKRELKRKIERIGVPGIDIKQDGSIDRDDDTSLVPLEITCLVRQDDSSNLKKLTDLLSDLEATVNKSCGLHVHVDARKFSKEEVLEIGKTIETDYLRDLSFMVPNSRRNNSFCKLKASTSDRYSAINLCAYEKQETIEFRLHSATTDFKKISSWCLILSHVIHMARTHVGPFVTTEDFAASLPTKELKEYYLERVELFNPRAYPETESEADEEDESTTERADLIAV